MATMTHRNRNGNGARYEKLERLLVQQDAVLRNRRQTLLANEQTEMSGVMDTEESSVDAEEQGIGFSVLGLTSRTVQGLEDALRRLAVGEYGVCSDCRSPIGAGRLRALPFAALCLECQEKDDSAGASVSGKPAEGWKERVQWNHRGPDAQ